MRNYLPYRLGAVAVTIMAATLVAAQDPPRPIRGESAIELFEPAHRSTYPLPDAPPSPALPTSSAPRTGAELRRAQAIYQSQMRMARIEAAKAMGYHLSRPNLPANPMMTSRYAPRRTLIMPVYYYLPAR